MRSIIGVDFDNTLVCYDRVFFKTAVGQRLIPEDSNMQKIQIRDYVRRQHDGEKKWQRLQALAYGKHLIQASLFSGVDRFFERCREKGSVVYIISHKTLFAAADVDKSINLQDAALAYMQHKNFFSTQGLGLSHSNVFFEETRSAKIQRIKSLGCNVFIDDLEELFLEPEFPKDVHKILFSPNKLKTKNNITVCKDWKAVTDCLF